MNLPSRLTSIPKASQPVLLAIVAGAAFVAFLVGFIPMWIKAEHCAGELRQAKQRGVIVSLQSTLGSATIDARRGQYEDARRQTSQFFTVLRANIEQGAESAFSPAQREQLGLILAERDNLITLLARNDPASVDRLSDLHLAYRKAAEQGSVETKSTS